MPAVRYWLPSRINPNWYWEPKGIMPRIPDEHLRSIVFIYDSIEAAREGRQVGGSGFVVNCTSGVGNFRVRYVLTNQHVLDHGGYWVRLNNPIGPHPHAVVHVPEEKWFRAPDDDDFAIAVLPLPTTIRPLEITLENFAVTRELAKTLSVGPGDEAYMVGRFIAHGGRITNNPIARFGSVALMPNPLELVHDGRGKDVEAYLIEMRSHSGFSGSPVFLLIPANTFRGEFGDTSMDDFTTRFRLLGIDTGHKIDRLPLQQWQGDEWRNQPDYRIPHYSDIAIVAPIWKVVDLLNREDLAEQRRQWGLEYEAKHGNQAAASDIETAVELGDARSATADRDDSTQRT